MVAKVPFQPEVECERRFDIMGQLQYIGGSFPENNVNEHLGLLFFFVVALGFQTCHDVIINHSNWSDNIEMCI